MEITFEKLYIIWGRGSSSLQNEILLEFFNIIFVFEERDDVI